MLEFLDIVDENGEPTGKTVERKKAHAEGIRHRTSHVWLARKRNGRVEILMQKRAENKDSYPGCYDISSAGHIPAGDGFEESAVRELREELGVKADEGELIYCGDRNVQWDDVFSGKPFHDNQFSRVFLLWRNTEEDQFTLQKEELESVKWIPFDECVDGVLNNKFKNCIATDELMILKNGIEKTERMFSDENGKYRQKDK